MEHKDFLIEELKVEDDARTVEGWVSVFNNVDAGKDIVMPGAFLKTLSRRKANDKVVMLWQHDAKEPIGVWDELREIDKGLYGKGTLFDTSRGNDAYKLLKGGAVKGISIGYSTKQCEVDQQKGVRKLTEVELFEASMVTFPMNDKATVTRVKSLSGLGVEELFEHKRGIEAALRDAGASESAAAYIAALIPTPAQRDAGGDGEQKEIAELLGAFATRFKPVGII